MSAALYITRLSLLASPLTPLVGFKDTLSLLEAVLNRHLGRVTGSCR